MPKAIQVTSGRSGILNPKPVLLRTVQPCISVSQCWKESASKPVSEGPREGLGKGKEREAKRSTERGHMWVEHARKSGSGWERLERPRGDEMRYLKEGMVRECGSGYGESWGLGSRNGSWQPE